MSSKKRLRVFTEDQLLVRRSRAYVFTYLNRGAIVPPVRCESCDSESYDNGFGKAAAPLKPFHPDPSKYRSVVWLCQPCHTRVVASLEVVQSYWVWPGFDALYVRTPLQDEIFSLCSLAESSLAPMISLPGLRMQSMVQQALSFLTARRIDRLYRDGIRSGRTWKPTGHPFYDVAFREWLITERIRRTETDREKQPKSLKNLRPAFRIRRQVILEPLNKVSSSVASTYHPVDMKLALDDMAEAELAADHVNSRIEALLSSR